MSRYYQTFLFAGLLLLLHGCAATSNQMSLQQPPMTSSTSGMNTEGMNAGMRGMGSETKGTTEIRMLHQISPFPKYMMIITLYQEELTLTPEQVRAFEVWRHEHMGPWSVLYAEVLAEDEAIVAASYQYQRDSEALLPGFRANLEKRYQLAEMTAACTNNARQILTEAQWDEMIRIYRSLLGE